MKFLGQFHGLGLQETILFQNLAVTLTEYVETAENLPVLSSHVRYLSAELVQMLLFSHAGPPGGFPVGQHPPLLPLVNYCMLLLLRFVRRRIAGRLSRMTAGAGGILTNVTTLGQGFAGLRAAAAVAVVRVTESGRRIQHEIIVIEEGFIAFSA